MAPPRLVLDRRTLRMIALSFVLLAGLSIHRLWFASDPNARDVLVFGGETMGTTYEIRIAGDRLNDGLQQRAMEETEARLTEIDGWMSTWNPDSEISGFNAHRDTTPYRVSHETANLVAFAVELGKWSGGAFDISVGPLVALWGFGSEARFGDPPSDAEIEAALQNIGARLIRIARGSPTDGGFLRKERPDLQIDLSAIAKGYGVDYVAAGLYALGREDFLVEIGGEIYAAGERPGGGPWRLAIEKPLDDGRAVQRVVELSDQGMATSGDYRIFYVEDGQRISHTIDPRTGRPVLDGPASATVIAGSASEADGWATTMMVLGEDGLELADAWQIGALLLVRDGEDGLRERRSARFAALASGDAAAAPREADR